MRKIFFTLCFIWMVAAVFAGQALYPAEVKPYNGAPTMFVNNAPLYPSGFRCWPLEDAEYSAVLRAMSQAGVKVYFVDIHLGEYWTGEGEFHPEKIDAAVKAITDNVSEPLIIPIIGLHHNMFWWYYKNISERTIDGLNPDDKTAVQKAYACVSFGSMKFRTEAADAIRRILKHIEKQSYGGKVIGYQIAYGAYNEWIPWGLNNRKYVDFNPGYVALFREWLKQKYKSDAALQNAWKQKDTSLTSARPFLGRTVNDQNPVKGRFIDPAVKKQLLDNREFMSELVTDTALFFAGVIKQATSGKALVGMYSGANYQYQHLIKLLKSKDIDFLCSSTGYGDRAANGVTYDQCFTLESLRAHNKIYLHDADIRTYMFPASKAEYFGGTTDFGRLRNVYDSIMVLRREWGAMMIHGDGIVWLNILRQPVFQVPGIMRDICRMAHAGNASLAFDRGSNAEIAVITRQRSSHYAAFYGAGVIRAQLYRAGAPVDIYSSEDISSIKPGKYKLVIVIMAQLLTDSERKQLNRLKSENTTFLWSMGTGYINETGFSISAMDKLTGLKFKKTIGDLPVMDLSRYNFKYLDKNVKFFVLGMAMGQHGAAYFQLEKEAGLEILGTVPRDNGIVFAAKQMSGWRSVAYPGFVVPGAIIREIAAQAGVHIYSAGDNGFYCNRHFMVVSAPLSGGRVTINLPAETQVWDIFAEQSINTSGSSFTIDMSPKSTSVFFTGTAAEVEKFKKLYSSSAYSNENWRWSRTENTPAEFNYHGTGGVVNVLVGSTKDFEFRIAANKDLPQGAVMAEVPAGWQTSPIEFGPLEANEIIYLKVPVTVPVNASLQDFKLKFTMNVKEHCQKSLGLSVKVSPFVYLSDMAWDNAVSGWKEVLKDRSVSGRPVFINRRKYAKGFGAHADSEIIYSIGGQWGRLEAVIGIDDAAGTGSASRATAVFEVWGDGCCLYKSRLLKGGGKPENINVNIAGVKQLRLVTADGGDGKTADHTDWADVKLYRTQEE